MGKSPFNSKQITIERLRDFLRESVNLEPELEQFIKTLIFSLEFSGQNSTTAYPLLYERQSKAQH